MNEDLDHIMNEILGEEAIIKYCGDDLKQIIIKDSCDTLKKAFQKIIYINPVSFITNDCQLKVDKIFVDIEIRKGRRRGEGKHIDFCDILISVQNTSVSSSVSSATQRQDSSARPQMLLLEGLAGSGKTTLVTMIIQEWIQGSGGNITDLDNFDLLLWVQCRNPTINSYQELLDRLMPDVSTKFGNFLPKIVKLCKVLIIVDGLDELNNHSRALIKSLLYEFKTSTSTTFICTSRPETVEIFSITIPEEFVVVNAELRGISKEHIKEFVRRTHQEVTKHTKSNRNTEELINKVKMFKDHHEHLRLPMNLIFFVYIWDQACDKLSTVALTQTELYHEIHRLCQKKLLERLLKYPKIKDINESSLDHKVHEVMRRIYIISLKNLSREQLAFQEATIEQLISLCSNHDLPYDEVLSAFLSLKPIWTWRGVEERYSAPHKGIQDYWSALHIVMSLKDQLQASALPVSSSPTPAQLTRVLPSTVQPAMAPLIPVSPVSIREILERSVGAAIEDMTKYQNVLVHVAGLLHLLLDEVPETITQEAVQLAHEAKERNRLEGLSRRINITHWYNLLENTKYNNDIARVIAGFINSGRPFTVNENYVESCMALLPHLRPSEVGIFFTSDGTGLIELLDVLARYNHRCTHLDLKHHYLHDVTTTTSDDILQHVQPR
nr:uncharacterized protein LOC128703947 [Cherax quadricarinatus]